MKREDNARSYCKGLQEAIVNNYVHGIVLIQIFSCRFGLQGEVELSAFPNVTFAFQGAALTVQPDDYMFLYEATTRRGTGSTILACPTFISDQEQGLTILGGNVLETLFFFLNSQGQQELADNLLYEMVL
jgi:hypothetical protein